MPKPAITQCRGEELSPWKVATDQSASLETADQQKTEKPESEPKSIKKHEQFLAAKLTFFNFVTSCKLVAENYTKKA